MLDYAGYWHRFWVLVKYINYERLLQGIASLCPTREWFVHCLTGELCGVHLQLIRGEEAGASGWAGIFGQCKETICAKAGQKNMLQPEPPAKEEGVCSIRGLCGPLCRGGVCDILGQSL